MLGKCKRGIASFLFNLLCLVQRSEHPSETELIAYGKDMKQREAAQTSVWVDPVVRAYPQMGYYEPPERTTEPIRLPSPHGTYFLENRNRFTHVAAHDTQEVPAIRKVRLEPERIDFWEERREV